jgi:N-acetylglutamate synthase-like GNAT family acetyltransferase
MRAEKVATRAKKIRRRNDGELMVEQTRDMKTVAAMLEAAGMDIAGLDWPAGCYLMAYFGNQPAGVVGVETQVDVALIRSLVVAEAMRHGGVGAALINAARLAAHTRGARWLYALTSDEAAGYLAHFGFMPVAIGEALDTLAGTFMADYIRSRPGEIARCAAFCLDISRDGVIIR